MTGVLLKKTPNFSCSGHKTFLILYAATGKVKKGALKLNEAEKNQEIKSFIKSI